MAIDGQRIVVVVIEDVVRAVAGALILATAGTVLSRDVVGEQVLGGLCVAGVARGDRGRGDDIRVRVDAEVALVAVESAGSALVPVPGIGIDGGDNPVLGHPPGDRQDSTLRSVT